MSEIPKFISIDDHVIEPKDLWTSRLPAKYQGIGPRVERLPAGELALAGARYVERPGTDGPLVDYWVYEDLHQSLKRAVAASGGATTPSCSSLPSQTSVVPGPPYPLSTMPSRYASRAFTGCLARSTRN